MDAQLEGSLNTLGEAERAAERVSREPIMGAAETELPELLKKAGHDEGYHAGELSAHVRRLGGMLSGKTGDFMPRRCARSATSAASSTCSIAAALGDPQDRKRASPLITDPELRAFLSAMAKGHHVNIGAIEEALKEGLL